MTASACLTAGFDIVARYPLLIALPVLLDMLLWLGPRLSVAPLALAWQAFINRRLTVVAPTSEAREGYLLMEQLLERVAAEFNLFSAVSPAPLLGVPVLMPARMTSAQPLMDARAIIVVDSLWAVVVWVSLALVVGVMLSTVYLTWIGQRVIRDTDAPLAGVDSLGQVGVRLAGSLVWLVVITGGLLVAVMVVVQGIAMISVMLGSFALLTILSLAFFMALHLLFVVPSIVQMRRSVWQAVRESILLARGDLFNTSLLVLFMMVITQGFMVVWQLPEPGSWAMLVGILGHAVISTALTTALFIFYQERLNFLKTEQKVYTVKEVPVQPMAGD